MFFAGWRSHEELAQVLACGDLLAVPSVAERFGQVYVEAMAMRLPVIACDVAAPPTYIDADPASPDRSGWLVPPDDEAALARALVDAASDPAERAIRGENGRRRARERFSVGARRALRRGGLRGGHRGLTPLDEGDRREQGPAPARHVARRRTRGAG